MKNKTLNSIQQAATGLAFIAYPILAGFAFAVHPNLFDLNISHDINARIAGFHGNDLLHFGHFLMTLAAPLLVVIAVHIMQRLTPRAPWLGFIGMLLAGAGAFVLALDKAALCLVPSAFDTLPEAAFQALQPGIAAMFQYQGGLWLLWLLPILPLGFILQSIAIVISKSLPYRQSIPILVGSVLMANPDIDLIGLVATLILAIGFLPYGYRLVRSSLQGNLLALAPA